MVPWQPQRAKVQLRLANQRLRMLQEKKLALAKQARREIADLVAKNRIETARLKVESLIQEDISVELLELLELYTETLLARFPMLEISKEEPEPSVKDAVCAVVYAAPHTELRELHVAREMIMHKLGRTYSIQILANDPQCVPERITKKLEMFVPSKELVDAYMEEIAKGYGLSWRAKLVDPELGEAPSGLKLDEGESEDDQDAKKSDEKVERVENTSKADESAKKTPEVTSKATIDKEEIHPGSLLPGVQTSTAGGSAKETEQDELDALAARFNALKKR